MANAHNTDLYVVGKGILSIAERSGNTIGTYYDAGNCPSMQVEPAVEKLPHYSQRTGYRTKDKNPIIQTDYSVTFQLDEFSASNLAKFLIGTVTDGMVVRGLQGSNKEYALRFISDNPTGPNQQWDFWRVTLSPNGPLQLIGDEWLIMDFQAEGLSDVAAHPVSPYFDVDYAAGYTETSLSESSDSSSSESSSSS